MEVTCSCGSKNEIVALGEVIFCQDCGKRLQLILLVDQPYKMPPGILFETRTVDLSKYDEPNEERELIDEGIDNLDLGELDLEEPEDNG